MTLPGYFAGKLSWDITTTQVNSALHPSGVAKSSTSFGRGKGGKVTSAGWQVTLCDLIWHVISRSGVVISITNCYVRFTYLLTYFTGSLLVALKRAACFVGDEMKIQTYRWTELLQLLKVTTTGSYTGSHEVMKCVATLLMCSCDSSFQMVCRAAFNSSVVLGFDWTYGTF